MREPILSARHLTKEYAPEQGCLDIDLDVWPGEVLGIVGESGSGKSTLLRLLSGQEQPDSGTTQFVTQDGETVELTAASESDLRYLGRTEFGIIHQNPRDGLRLRISAGGNIGERLMGVGERHYGDIRARASEWMQEVEIDSTRIDDKPLYFSGGMQQRLQIARNLVTNPRLIFMDEPTGGLDVSVQARLLDTLKRLVQELGIAVVIVTHDMGVARLLADRLLVMKNGRVIESGLTDQVLDDPHAEYTQQLVASILQVN